MPNRFRAVLAITVGFIDCFAPSGYYPPREAQACGHAFALIADHSCAMRGMVASVSQ